MPSTTLVSNPLNVEVKLVFMDSVKVFRGSPSLSLCFAQVTWFAVVVVPSSGGAELLYPDNVGGLYKGGIVIEVRFQMRCKWESNLYSIDPVSSPAQKQLYPL